MTVGDKDKSAPSGCSGMASPVLTVAHVKGAKGQSQRGLARELVGAEAHISNILKDAGL